MREISADLQWLELALEPHNLSFGSIHSLLLLAKVALNLGVGNRGKVVSYPDLRPGTSIMYVHSQVWLKYLICFLLLTFEMMQFSLIQLAFLSLKDSFSNTITISLFQFQHGTQTCSLRSF